MLVSSSRKKSKGWYLTVKVDEIYRTSIARRSSTAVTCLTAMILTTLPACRHTDEYILFFFYFSIVIEVCNTHTNPRIRMEPSDAFVCTRSTAASASSTAAVWSSTETVVVFIYPSDSPMRFSMAWTIRKERSNVFALRYFFEHPLFFIPFRDSTFV